MLDVHTRPAQWRCTSNFSSQEGGDGIQGCPFLQTAAGVRPRVTRARRKDSPLCTICSMLQAPRCSLHRHNFRVLISPDSFCRASCVRIAPTRRQQACDQRVRTDGLGWSERTSRKPVGCSNALPQALQPLLANTLARDAAAATAELIAGTLLVKLFDFLQCSGVMEKVRH